MSLSVKIDLSSVAGLADKLASLDSKEFGRVALDAVNAAADEVYQLVVPRLNASINLPDNYVRDRMQIVHGTSTDRPASKIVATGSKPSMTQLARYSLKQEIQPNKWKRSGRKGDASRGIPLGSKQAGVSVEVTRGSRKLVERGFLIELNNGNGFGIATRTGTGKKDYRIRYGPSVYQLFKVAAAGVLDEAADILEDRLVDEANRLIAKTLGDSI